MPICSSTEEGLPLAESHGGGLRPVKIMSVSRDATVRHIRVLRDTPAI